MTHRSTLRTTLAAALAASVLTAGPAVAMPMEDGPAVNGGGAGTTEKSPAQDLRGEHARDAARNQVAPGQPTWPVNPTPLPAPAAPAKASSDGGGRTGKKVKAPVRDEWFGSPAADAVSFQAHPQYGFMCPVLKPDVETP